MVAKPTLLYVVSEDWYFLSHRLPMARAARDAGFDVHVATRVVDGAQPIEAEGFTLHAIPFVRGKLSPLPAIRTILALRRLYGSIRPDICHHVSLQPAVFGSLAAVGKRISVINALTGLGYVFASGGRTNGLRWILGTAFRLLFARKRHVVLLQNPTDQATLLAVGVPQHCIAIIPGSGVDADMLQPLPEPAGPLTIGYVGRLLGIKGVRTLVEAHRLLRSRGAGIELLVAGTPDPANPGSLTEQEIAGWRRLPGVTLLGHVRDVSQFWERAHIAVLVSSGGEGLPKALLEAAACGRPMVGSDVPGCREIVRPRETGLLVPPDDAATLADAIEELAASPELRARYGAAARQLVVERFDARLIGVQIVALYSKMMEAERSGRSAL